VRVGRLSFCQHNNEFYNSERIEKIYQFIKENYHRNIKVEEVAGLVNMSVILLSRLIKQRTGKSFIGFLKSINTVPLLNSEPISLGSKMCIDQTNCTLPATDMLIFLGRFKEYKISLNLL